MTISQQPDIFGQLPQSPAGFSKAFQDWLRIKEHLKEMMDLKAFKDFVEPIRIKEEHPSEITLCFPDMILYQSAQQQVLTELEALKATLGVQTLFKFEVAGLVITPDSDFALEYSEDNPTESSALEKGPDTGDKGAVSRALSFQSHLNKEYTFKSFVKGPSNQFAHAACLAVADNPGRTYNPLFVYGSTGLGKTHLLHAVGNRVLEAKPDAVITYITSERFMNEMIYCLRFEKMHEFRKKYRNCDVLLVDDIQFIAGKVHTQEEFFHTFNALYESKGQIVVTSDQFPQDIADIEDRLRNRFQWGLIADIQAPDVEHRVAILMLKADKLGVSLSHDVAFYIAQHAKGNVRVLEGSLKRIAAFANLQGRPLNLELASEILHAMVPEPVKGLSVEAVIRCVAEHFGLRVSDLKSKKRARILSLPRQIAMYLARMRLEASFPEIGTKFGGKDHTTVLFAFKKIKSMRDEDLDLKTSLETIERRLDQMV